MLFREVLFAMVNSLVLNIDGDGNRTYNVSYHLTSVHSTGLDLYYTSTPPGDIHFCSTAMYMLGGSTGCRKFKDTFL